MRLRASHVTVLIGLFLGAFMVYAVVQAKALPDKESQDEASIPFPDPLRVAASGQAGTLPPLGADQQDVPRVEVETRSFDLGIIDSDRISAGRLKIHNRGSQPLEITRVATSCGCTTAKMVDGVTSIAPGESRELELSVNPAKIAGFKSKKTVTLETNDPHNPRMQVDVLAAVKPEFSIDPETIDLGVIDKGEVRTVDIVFRPENDSGVNLLSVKSMRQAQGLEFAISDRPKEAWASPDVPEKLIQLTLNSQDIPVGDYSGYFALETDATRKVVQNYQCKISAVVSAFYRVDKKMISLGMMVPGKQRDSAAVISSDKEFELLDLAISGDAFTVSSEPAEDGKSYLITVAYNGSEVPGRKVEQVTFKVKTADETVEDSIRVYGAVRKRVGATVNRVPSSRSATQSQPAGAS